MTEEDTICIRKDKLAEILETIQKIEMILERVTK